MIIILVIYLLIHADNATKLCSDIASFAYSSSESGTDEFGNYIRRKAGNETWNNLFLSLTEGFCSGSCKYVDKYDILSVTCDELAEVGKIEKWKEKKPNRCKNKKGTV